MPAPGKHAKLPQKIQCNPRQDLTHHNGVANPSRLPAVLELINWIGCHLQITLSATKQLMPDPCCLATGWSLLCNRSLSAVALMAISDSEWVWFIIYHLYNFKRHIWSMKPTKSFNVNLSFHIASKLWDHVQIMCTRDVHRPSWLTKSCPLITWTGIKLLYCTAFLEFPNVIGMNRWMIFAV